MKKAIALLAVMAALSGMLTSYAMPATALEAVTMEEHSQQYAAENEGKLPDTTKRYEEVTENDLVYHVYDEYAFLADCKNREITEVTVPAEINGVPVLGSIDSPFGFCRNLTTINLPDSFRYIDWDDLCSTIVTKVGSTEDPMPSVSAVNVSEDNPWFTLKDGLIYSKDMKTLIGCPPASDMKELKISDQTETIGDYAFFACLSLEKAVIPSTVKHINNNAFTGCMNLKSAELPETITDISGDMFFFCTSLTDVKFNGTIRRIGYGAFNNCPELKDFTIPETVTYIGSKAFEQSGCVTNENGIHYVGNWVVGCDEDATSAVIREGTVGLSEAAFLLCGNVDVLDVPASVEHIGLICFSGLSVTNPKAAVIKYRCKALSDKVMSKSRGATDIYFYDPECDIFDSETTVPARYAYYPKSLTDIDDEFTLPVQTAFITADNESAVEDVEKDEYGRIVGDIVIHGYEGSTAQKYAEKYERKFELIEGEPATEPATKPVTTAPVTEPATKPVTTAPATEAATKPATTAPATEAATKPVTTAPVTEAATKPVTTEPVTEPEKKSGDANGDGVFGIADAVTVQKWLLGDNSAEVADWKAADLNGNGRLDVFDFTLMRRKLLEIL